MSSRRPRHRYVAFRVEGPRAFRRDEVLRALRDAPVRLWLVDYRGGWGLVRCGHLDKDAAIAALRSIEEIVGEPATVRTLGTSGTIRRATAKYLPRTRDSRGRES